jgi:hypothetical protein
MTAGAFKWYLLIQLAFALPISAVFVSHYDQHKQADELWRTLSHNCRYWWEGQEPRAEYTEQTDPAYTGNCKSTKERTSKLLKLMRLSNELEDKRNRWSRIAAGVWTSLFFSIIIGVLTLFFTSGKRDG